MSYVQQGLTDGTVLAAAHLNHIDAGIAANDTATAALAERVTEVETKLQAASGSES